MARGTILVVDDDLVVRSLLRRDLAGWGFEVLQAATGTVALQALALQPVTLMLLDYSLPDMTGLDVLDSLPPEMADTLKVIVITSSTDRGVYDAFMQGSFTIYDFMEKPLNMAQLRESIETIFQAQRA